jgi:glycosyltransferase involved in cell wall biosynthesis
MSKVSIIIPARGESYEHIQRTVTSILENATGEIEIIIGYDGTPRQDIGIGDPPGFDNFSEIIFPSTVGIKTNINAMAAMATGKYIYKSDAHCAFGKGFDEILQQNMQEDWLVMPRFKIIKEDWSIQMRDGKEEFYDYFYLCCPFTDPKGFRFKAGGHWPERTAERNPFDGRSWSTSNPGFLIDETPQIHGSGWFMSKDRYFELGGFPNIDPYGHAQEPIWLALKNWLMGGKVMVNKNTWYAHLHQQGNKRGYHMDKAQEDKSYLIAADHFVYNSQNYPHNFEWFVDTKFPGMPTWPENWKELRNASQLNEC